MADQKEIVIDIRSSQPSATGQSVGKDEEASSFSKDLSELLHPIRTLETETIGKNIILNQAYQNAKQNVKQMIDFSLNRYFNMKEDYLSQNTFNHVKTAISKVGSFFEATGAGALAGSKFGLPGAVVGAAVGATGNAISQVVSYEQRMSGYYSALNATNFQTSFQASKMNLIDDNRNTLN